MCERERKRESVCERERESVCDRESERERESMVTPPRGDGDGNGDPGMGETCRAPDGT